MSTFPALNNAELESISNILGDTTTGFTGSEISRLLSLCHIPDAWPNGTKRLRIFNSLAEECNRSKSSNCVYAFILEALEPSRWLDAPEAYSAMRIKINEVLALKGIQLNDENKYVQITMANSVSEAKKRASQLSRRLYDLHMHPEVLKCCKEELLQENYFHAVHEAAKSLTDRISVETGLELGLV